MSSITDLRSRVRLIRLPLAFSTVADVWAGWFGSGHAFEPRLLILHGAALAFYFAGMTLNDLFDAPRDRVLHPERPLPMGTISVRAAAAQGVLLLGAGLGLATAAGQPGAGALLAATILGYDAILKRWALPGALAMGACRYLDVQLGAELAQGWAFGPALALGGYVAAVTLISTLEDRPDADRPKMQRITRTLLLGIFFVNAGSLYMTGHPLLAIATAALAVTFPLLVRLARAGIL
jgi:4-hydroxybenzoate polyprenyltransferase